MREYLKTKKGILYQGHVLEVLKQLPSESVDCVVTSPPYWGMRFYGNNTNTVWGGNPNCNHEWDNEKIKLNFSASEKSKLCSGRGRNPKNELMNGEYITGFCKKCGAWYGQLGLEPDYKMYLENLWTIFKEIKRILKPTGTLWVNIGDKYNNTPAGITSKNFLVKRSHNSTIIGSKRFTKEVPLKSLCLLPERFAKGMVERGWHLERVIIWYKPNAMPESVKDRFTRAYEYIYLFTKSKEYYLNEKENTCVWSISTKPLKELHFAPFPIELAKKCIETGSPKGGVVMDPFAGSGTTLVVSHLLGRKWIGIEINPDFCEIIRKRINSIILPLFEVR